ncbi:MAG TPA: NAD(P)-dependent oxidoreductase, partial [Candidatus Cloacimonadota bacterium]|nr:NAD(P)-dependent oxidoreductase [Candidatus Cloacimonadota bacterium]
MSTRFNVLISAPYLVNDIYLFKDEIESKNIILDIKCVNERLEEIELLEIIEQYDAVICGDDRFTHKVYDKASKLKVVVKWGTGIDSLNKEYAQSKNIQVFNTPDAFTEPVSDSVLAFILAFSRQIVNSDKLMKDGLWQKCQGNCLNEQSLGIIGFGRIGKAVAKKANAFGMRIFANDIKEIPDEIVKDYNVEMLNKSDLLQQSDFVSINCDLNPTSYHLMSDMDFSTMKKNAIIINTARGPIIDEKALINALENKKIAGAGLDVFEEEPLPYFSPLRQMENTILSSHNVNTSPKYWKKV